MSTDLIQRLDTAYKSCLPAGDLWNLCAEAANELERLAAVEAERDQLRAEVEAMRRHQPVCSRCGLRFRLGGEHATCQP